MGLNAANSKGESCYEKLDKRVSIIHYIIISSIHSIHSSNSFSFSLLRIFPSPYLYYLLRLFSFLFLFNQLTCHFLQVIREYLPVYRYSSVSPSISLPRIFFNPSSVFFFFKVFLSNQLTFRLSQVAGDFLPVQTSTMVRVTLINLICSTVTFFIIFCFHLSDFYRRTLRYRYNGVAYEDRD